MFIGLRADRDLGQGHAGLDGVGGQQMHRRHVAITGAAERLAVQGQVDGMAGPIGGPGPQSGLDLLQVELAQEIGEGGLAGHPGAVEAEFLGLARGEAPAELGGGAQAAHAAEDRRRQEVEDGGQRIPLAARLAWVRDEEKAIRQGEGRHDRASVALAQAP